MKSFIRYSLPTADSSRATVSYWRKVVHQVLVNRLGLRQPRKSAVKLTDHLNMTVVVDWDVIPQNKQTNLPQRHLAAHLYLQRLALKIQIEPLMTKPTESPCVQ